MSNADIFGRFTEPVEIKQNNLPAIVRWKTLYNSTLSLTYIHVIYGYMKQWRNSLKSITYSIIINLAKVLEHEFKLDEYTRHIQI